MLTAILAAIVLLLVLGLAGAAFGRTSAHVVVYLGAAIASATVAASAFAFLVVGDTPSLQLSLPVGLPWLSSHLRLDALSAWFLVVAGIGGFAASVYGMGYGTHVDEPARVLPFFPVFLAGMNLVPVADDAFTFLLAWEFMPLSSWLLVLANHRQADNARAAYVYLVMAMFSGACLLLRLRHPRGVPWRVRRWIMRHAGFMV